MEVVDKCKCMAELSKVPGESKTGYVVRLIVHFRGDFGRIRTIREGPDGMFYILTNNTDGRGTPEENDNRVIKIDPKMFRE